VFTGALFRIKVFKCLTPLIPKNSPRNIFGCYSYSAILCRADAIRDTLPRVSKHWWHNDTTEEKSNQILTTSVHSTSTYPPVYLGLQATESVQVGLVLHSSLALCNIHNSQTNNGNGYKSDVTRIRLSANEIKMLSVLPTAVTTKQLIPVIIFGFTFRCPIYTDWDKLVNNPYSINYTEPSIQKPAVVRTT